MESGIIITIKTGVETTLTPQYRLLSSVFHDSGDLRNAQTYVENALELSEKCGQRHFQGYAGIYLGRKKGKRISQTLMRRKSVFCGASISWMS